MLVMPDLKEINKELKETIKKMKYQNKQLAKDLQVAVLRNNQKGDIMEYGVIELLQEIKSLLTEKPIKEKWIGISEASDICGCSKATIRRYIKTDKNPEGQLQPSRATGRLLFERNELLVWMRGNG